MTKTLLSLFMLILLVSCNSNEPLTNNEIDVNLRNSFKSKNDSIAMTVRTNNKNAYYLLGSQDFYASIKKNTETLNQIYWDLKITSAPTVMDEFYITEEGIKNHEIHSDKNGYTIRFANTQKESYVSVLKIHANEQQHYLIAIVYERIEKAWKIEKMIPARYSFFGYDANAMYDMAKEKEAKDFIVDAFVFANSAFNLVNNGSKDFIFDQVSEKKDYRNNLLKKLEARHGKFPIDIKETNPASQLLGFDMAYYKKGLHTAVHYGTWVSMDNVPALTSEYEGIKKYIAKNFSDLDRNQPYVFYRAFSQVPDSNGRFDIHGFLDENSKLRVHNK